MDGAQLGYGIKVDIIERAQATRARFAERLAATDYDIVHFAGHGRFDQGAPGSSAIRFADGLLTADEVGSLPWQAPPGFVFNSACESGRAGVGRRLVVRDRHSNGLAAAFIAAGTAAYAGYFWPVTRCRRGAASPRPSTGDCSNARTSGSPSGARASTPAGRSTGTAT